MMKAPLSRKDYFHRTASFEGRLPGVQIHLNGRCFGLKSKQTTLLALRFLPQFCSPCVCFIMAIAIACPNDRVRAATSSLRLHHCWALVSMWLELSTANRGRDVLSGLIIPAAPVLPRSTPLHAFSPPLPPSPPFALLSFSTFSCNSLFKDDCIFNLVK